MVKKHLTIHVFGSVQGVFFRAETVEKACELGLSGWARNEPDGSVLIEAEGDKQELERLVAWCHEGPAVAQIERVEASEGLWQNMTGFEIQY